MPRLNPVRASRAQARWLVLAAGFAAVPVVAAAQDAPPSRIGPIWDGQRHQPTRGAVQEQQHEEGVAPGAQQSRDQLRELNDISRQLLPPGSPVPAPSVEGQGQAPAGR